jgi:hypothetical protein
MFWMKAKAFGVLFLALFLVLTTTVGCKEDSDTDADCSRPPIPSLVDAPFEIIVPVEEAFIGEEVTFTLQATEGADLSNYSIDWFVDVVDGPQPYLSGASVSHTYGYPGRFRIVATVTNNSDASDKVELINYLNVYRPYEETIYAHSDGELVAQGGTSIGNPGSGDWCHYNYDVYKGKYYELWVQQDHPDIPAKELLLEALSHADIMHQEYSHMFGWDLRTHNEGQKMVLCSDVQGAGGGSGGMFWPNISINPDTGTAGSSLWADIIHEFMHQWDFRGDLHLGGPEAAHALTSSQEYLAYTLTGTPRVTHGERFYPVEPHYNDTHVERTMYHRYLQDDSYDWSSIYSDQLMAMEYGTHPLPENKEHMLIMGGVLMAFYRMHGPEGLRAYYQQIDVLLLEHPEWDTGIGTEQLSHEQRRENMLIAMSRAVRFDVSDYYDAWKFPVSERMRNDLARYPESPMLLDKDKDGFSPVEGDQNDCDSAIYPEAPELIDGKDNNQDGLVDETVLSEKIKGDIADITAKLPLFIQGTISDISDEDIYRFTIPDGKRAVVVTLTLGAPTAVNLYDSGPDANRPNKLFSGSYFIDGHGQRGSIYTWSHIPTMYFILDGDGSEKTIRVDASTVDGMNPNPGDYEIQVFISEATNRDMSTAALVGDLYP